MAFNLDSKGQVFRVTVTILMFSTGTNSAASNISEYSTAAFELCKMMI